MDEQLKQRLLGATIIVALVVIFVPMLFEDPDHPAGQTVGEVPALPEAIEERAIELPKSAADVLREEQSSKKEAAEAETSYRVIPLEDPPPPKPAKVEPAPAPAPEAAVAAEEPVDEAAPPDEEFVGEGEEAPMEAPAAPAATKAGLAEPGRQAKPLNPAVAPAKAAVPSKKPERAMADVKPEASAPRPKTPVPVPKPAEPLAKKPEKARPQQLKRAEPVAVKPAAPRPVPVPHDMAEAEPPGAKPAQFKPALATAVPLESAPKPPASKPPEPKAAALEAEPPTAWVVQAGSFAGEANARSLADRLRKQNIAAFVESVAGSAGTAYRVRVGPELNRSRAEQLQKQIESAVGIKGLILPRK